MDCNPQPARTMPSERFQIEPYESDEPDRTKSRMSGCLVGCLGAFGVSVILLVVAAVWISRNWQDWVADFCLHAIDTMVESSDLPELEKKEIQIQVVRVADAFSAGELPAEKMALIVEYFKESPLLTSMVVASVERKYFDRSGLTDEEKEQGRIDLRRFVRGMVDEEIDEDAFHAAVEPITDKRPDGGWRIRETVTDDQLRALLKAAKEKADAAGIPAEVEEVDPSDEVQRIIDAALLADDPEAHVELEPAEPQ